MDPNITAALIGLATGAVGSLAAPWANWKIEQQKQLREERRELINYWISFLSTGNIQAFEILEQPRFAPLQQHLRPSIFVKLKKGRFGPLQLGVKGARTRFAEMVFNDVLRLQAKWKLI